MSCGELGKGAKTEHTPEPWISEGSFIGIPNGKGTFYMSTLSGINQERREADARRIVACVNACAGLSTEFLEQIDSIQAALTGQLVVTEVLEKQRDELLAALENCRLLAARHRNEDWAGHVIRFLGEAGVKGEVMRDA